MKLFKCTYCGQLLYFENNHCEQCGHQLGFLAESLELVTLIAEGQATFSIQNNDSILYQYCANHAYDVCNWLVLKNSDSLYCTACNLNRTIPNLSKPENEKQWKVIETAKHRLIYTLLRKKLPLVSKTVDPHRGLCFDFLSDDHLGPRNKVLTGHARGLITLNIAEADDVKREMARKAMGEPYRTVLGHFRHESGHYYWDRLIADKYKLGEFRVLFGDEQQNYSKALKTHYTQGPPANWNLYFISDYASAHPWEDWAETWAHYLHIIDTLETAYAFGLQVRPGLAKATTFPAADIQTDPYLTEDFDSLMSMWLPLTFAMNSLNRSMGHHDQYPFVIPPKVVEKLKFIHHVCYPYRKES